MHKGVIIFPFGVSFLLPVFSVILVQEKEMYFDNDENEWNERMALLLVTIYTLHLLEKRLLQASI